MVNTFLLEAAHKLHTLDEFRAVREHYTDRYAALTGSLIDAVDDKQFRIMQGQAREVREFLNLLSTSRDVLERIKGGANPPRV